MKLVRRYKKPLTQRDLRSVLGGSPREVEPISVEIELTRLRKSVDEAVVDRSGSELDAALIEPVHSSLVELTRRDAADMRLWHWLCVDQFSDVVIRRWSMINAMDPLTPVTKGDSDRFLGRSTVAGMARNTLARLWWLAESLGDYELARRAVKNQDIYVNVFERAFGLVTPASEAALDRFHQPQVREDDWRNASKWLQQRVPTTVIESLDREELSEILDQSLSQAQR